MNVDDVRVEHAEGRWDAFVGEECVATFEFVEDEDGRMWLAEAHTAGTWQRQGIGRRVMREAVAYYDEVYASRASQREMGNDDTRYLTREGAALGNACIRDGIMKGEWLIHPLGDDRDEEPDRDGPG